MERIFRSTILLYYPMMQLDNRMRAKTIHVKIKHILGHKKVRGRREKEQKEKLIYLHDLFFSIYNIFYLILIYIYIYIYIHIFYIKWLV